MSKQQYQKRQLDPALNDTVKATFDAAGRMAGRALSAEKQTVIGITSALKLEHQAKDIADQAQMRDTDRRGERLNASAQGLAWAATQAGQEKSSRAPPTQRPYC